MNVGELMTRGVRSCHADDTLNSAAQIMWENDCGCVPVVDEEHRVVGILTDRDVCMAAYTQGGPLGALHVGSAMSKEVFSCTTADTLAAAEEAMRTHRVRRLPVVDGRGHLVGIISLNDIARAAARRRRARNDVTPNEIGLTLAAICAPHPQPSAAATA